MILFTDLYHELDSTTLVLIDYKEEYTTIEHAISTYYNTKVALVKG